MTALLIGSGNPKKIAELRRILEPLGLSLSLPTELPEPPPPPAETGASFEANASEKALYYAAHFGGPALADDSGLVVPALGGAPGIHSARFAGDSATDGDNNRKLLEEMRDFRGDDRRAHFVAVVALAEAGKIVCLARGVCQGRIRDEARGEGGFGYDPLFDVEGLGRSFAELDDREKNLLSHRGRALAELEAQLRAWLKGKG